MSRDRSWYRRTSWNVADQAEFEQRNGRSRGPDSKAQHVRLQADTLRRTGKPALVRAALELLQRSIREFPEAMDSALALECAGECCEELGARERAIDFYQRAMARERAFPGIGTNACFRLGKLVIEAQHADLYDQVIMGLERFGPPAFPWHVYMLNGIRAVIEADRGNISAARELARAAQKSVDALRGTRILQERNMRLGRMIKQLSDA